MPALDEIYIDKVIGSKCHILLLWRGGKYKFVNLKTAKDGSLYVFHAQFSDSTKWPFIHREDSSSAKTSEKFLPLEQNSSQDIHLSLHPRDNVILFSRDSELKRVRIPINWYPVEKPWYISQARSASLLYLNSLSGKDSSNTLKIKIPDDHVGSIAADVYIVPPFVSIFDVGKQKLPYIAVRPNHKQYSIWIIFHFLPSLPPALFTPKNPGSYGWSITEEQCK